MRDTDLDEEAGFPVERDEQDKEQKDDEPKGCCDKFHIHVSRWMLPEDLRETYLDRANCLPPPIFIILISLGEVGLILLYNDKQKRFL